jgi:tripartite-type tricarboxylate transporter receptor subunit TctC
MLRGWRTTRMTIGRRHLLRSAAAIAALPGLARAQQPWPDRPLRLVVPYAPGGTTDLFGRLVAQRMGEALGQTVVVENKPGAGGSLAGDMVAHAKPDGYTIMVGSNGPLVINPMIQASIGYDPAKDLAPIGLGLQVPMVVVVRADSPIRTAQDYVAAARRQGGGGVTAGCSGSGSSNHLAIELFNAAAGAHAVVVPYRGSGPMIADLLGGTLTSMFDQVTTSLPLQREGKARLLAVTGARRSPVLPEVPTLAEAGVQGAEITTWMGISAPSGLPEPVSAALARALATALAEPGLRRQLGELGAEVAEGALATPAGFGAFLREDAERMRRAVALAGLTPS